MPGWAMGTATAVAALQLGRLATSGEQSIVLIWSYIIFIACGVLVSIGGKIERTLEIANWIMLTVIFVSLLILDIAFAPASTWLEALAGYVSFGQITGGSRHSTPGRAGRLLRLRRVWQQLPHQLVSRQGLWHVLQGWLHPQRPSAASRFMSPLRA